MNDIANNKKRYELIDFLRDENTRFISSKIIDIQDTPLNSKCASDFDTFNSLCEYLYLLAGYPLRGRFLDLLSWSAWHDASFDAPFDALYDAECRKLLWQKIFINDDIIVSSAKGFGKINLNLKNQKPDEVFYLNSAINLSFESIHDLLDEILRNVRESNASIVFCDARKIFFARPDDFHAQKAYEGMKHGNPDCTLPLLWLLCRVLMNTELKLKLFVDSISVARDILSLIYRLGLSPKITICVECREGMDFLNRNASLECAEEGSIYELLKKYGEKNISLELFCTKENIELLIKFLEVVPLALVEKINTPISDLKKALGNILFSNEVEMVISHLGGEV